jgi:N-acetylmuramoyl-L-alanine amidase
VIPAAVSAAALICLDPGHGTPPAVGRQTEPIGPGSKVMKIKDGGGATGEAGVALAIALRARTLLLARGYRVAMTRTGTTFRYGNGGNIARAQFCNRRHAALMVRIHANGSGDTSLHGVSTLVPAWHRGWTDDIYAPSLRAGRALQRAVVTATGAADRGLVKRADLTGFNWANVPVVLVEAGFLSNPAERRLLHTGAYQQRVARGLLAGVAAFIALPSLQSGEGPRISSAAARPRSWTALRRSSTSASGPVTSSTGVSAASNSSRSSTIVRDSSSLRRSSSARGSSAGAGTRHSFR